MHGRSVSYSRFADRENGGCCVAACGALLDREIGIPPLFRLALSKGQQSLVRLHLRRGASANGRDSGGRTPLMIAAAAGRTDVCLLLLEEGADPLLQDLEGRTASQLAELEGHLDLALRLSKPVASIDTQAAEDHGAGIGRVISISVDYTLPPSLRTGLVTLQMLPKNCARNST